MSSSPSTAVCQQRADCLQRNVTHPQAVSCTAGLSTGDRRPKHAAWLSTIECLYSAAVVFACFCLLTTNSGNIMGWLYLRLTDGRQTQLITAIWLHNYCSLFYHPSYRKEQSSAPSIAQAIPPYGSQNKLSYFLLESILLQFDQQLMAYF